jgi:hypothetical protein
MAAPQLTAFVNGPIAVSADQLNTMMQTCDTAAQMRGLIGVAGQSLFARGMSAANDGDAGAFYWNTTSSGPDDGVNVIVPTGSSSGAWVRLAQNAGGVFVLAQWYGAKGDGVTNDSTAIQAALSAVQAAGGGICYLPPTGHAYLINTGLNLYNGCCLMGAGTHLFAGATATPAQWAAQGSWIQCTDMTNPAISMLGHGSSVIGLNFVYNQVVPSTGTYVPTAFPFCISMQVSYATIADCFIIGAYQGISVSLSSASGGGTGSTIRNCLISALRTGLQIINVNDTMNFKELWIENQWYALTTSVVNYLNANMTGIECHYCDNSNFDSIQIYQALWAITVTDSTCFGITHSMYNCLLTNMDFNSCIGAISVAATTTTVVAMFSNLLIQGVGGFSGVLFGLASNNVDMQINNMRIPYTGGPVMTLGNGSGGTLQLTNCKVLAYGQVLNASVCFSFAANTQVSLANMQITKAGATGAYYAGTGIVQSAAGSFWKPFAASAPATGTGAYIIVGTANYYDPIGIGGALQGRITGAIAVTTSQTSGTIALRLSNYTEIVVTGLSGATVSNYTFDSGWIDFTHSGGGSIGFLQYNATTGVVADLSGVVVEWR